MTRIFTVDAFAEAAFKGNPAGVCLLDEDMPDEWMRAVAAEMRHSETAFVLEVDGRISLRWFSPKVEVDLCGHATLATAHVLFALEPSLGRVEFDTRSGVLSATRDGDLISLDFPVRPMTEIDATQALVDVLGARPDVVGVCERTWVAVMASARDVQELDVDLDAVERLPIQSLVVTALADAADDYDFVSRYFRPVDGIPEDPVTGSAHCILGPYFGALLARDELVGYQASARGGRVIVRLHGDRVELAGRAVTVTAGELLV